MFFLLLGFWLILNGRFTLEILLTGMVVCALLWIFLWKFLGYSPTKEWRYLRRTGWLAGYFFFMLREIFLSSIKVIRLIWSPKLEPEQRIVRFPCRLKTTAGKVLLANSITLTPGTVTADIEGDLFTVHCLDVSMANGLKNSEMEQRIRLGEGGDRT